MADVEDPDFVETVEVSGRRHRVEYTFLATARLERATGQSYLDVARAIVRNKVTLDLAIELVRAGLNGVGEQLWSTAATAELLQRVGKDDRQKLIDAAMRTFTAMFQREFTDIKPAGKGPPPQGASPTTSGPTGPVSSAQPPA